jgi:hypothetical protein
MIYFNLKCKVGRHIYVILRKNKKAEMICQKAQTQNAETHKATPHPFSNYVLLTSIDETNVAKAICVYFFKSDDNLYCLRVTSKENGIDTNLTQCTFLLSEC